MEKIHCQYRNQQPVRITSKNQDKTIQRESIASIPILKEILKKHTVGRTWCK